MRRIRTVLGDIGTDGLGLVYSHEHLITDPPAIQKDRDLELSSYECSLRELVIFKESGGTLLVEATTLDYGRNPAAMARMSLEAGQSALFVRLPAPRCTFCSACLNTPAGQRAEERKQCCHHNQGNGERLAAADVVIIRTVGIG